jgi:PAS domain S-box-containing protein
MNPRTARALGIGLLLFLLVLLFPLALSVAVRIQGRAFLLAACASLLFILTAGAVLAWRGSVSTRSEREAELETTRDQLRGARDQAWQNALLVQLLEELEGLADERSSWDSVCSFLGRALDASRVVAYEKDVRGAYRLRTQFVADGILPLDEGAVLPGAMVHDRELARRIASSDLSAEEDPELRTLAGKLPPRSLFVVPVEREEKERAGALAIHHCDRPRPSSENERRFIHRVARHLGSSLDRAERSRRLARESDVRSGLLRFAQALAATRESRAVVEIAVSVGAPLARSPRSAVFLEDEDEGTSFRVADSGLENRLGPFLSILRTRIDEALRERAPVLLDGAEITAGRRSSPGSFALVPMFYGREPMGVFLFESGSPPEELDLEVARTVAELAAAALKNARRFESLEASEAGYAALYEECADILLVVDESGLVRASNPATRRALGYSESELAGVQLSALLSGDSVPAWRGLEKTLFREGRIHDAELKLKTKDGGIVEVLATAAVSVPGPLPSGVLRKSARILMRDVTELHALEHQLRHSQKLEVVGALAGGIAHDFNNVLGGILGYASLLRTHVKSRPIAAKYLETIERSAIRGAELTGRLLSASRKAPARWEPVNLNVVVEETLELLAHSLHKSIRLEKRLDPRVRAMMADASQLQQIVLNLCVNARDAMPDGGLLRVTTRLSDGGDKVHLTVEDTGIGMDAKTLARLFEPFFSTKGEAGTGLGLSVVYGIVRSLGGDVGVTSSPGRGARFQVVLPCHLAEEIPHAERAEEPAPGQGELILLVDDEKVLRDLGKDILESHGYRVNAVASGEEAIDFLRDTAEPVALVILDLVMPGLGGPATFRRLRSTRSAIPVLLSSGLAAEEIVQDLLEDGASGFIPKPYGIGDLTRAVSSALRRRNPTLVH